MVFKWLSGIYLRGGTNSRFYFAVWYVHVPVVFINNIASVTKQSLAQLAHALCDEKLDHSSLVQVFWPKSRFVPS